MLRLASIAASLSVLVASCAAPCISVEPRLAQLEASGHIAAAAPGNPLQPNDVEGALDLGKDDAAPGVRADFEFGTPHLVVSLASTETDGDGTLTGQLSDDGVVLPIGTDVATDVQLGVYSAIVTFDVVPGAMFELGPGLGVHVVDLDADVRSRNPGNPGTVSLETTVPIPVLALQGGFAYERLRVHGLVSGMHIAADGDEATFYDVDVGARVRLFGNSPSFALGLGWRYTRLDAEYEDDDDNADVDLKLSGPYVGLSIAF